MNKQAIKALRDHVANYVGSGRGEAYHSYIVELADAMLDEDTTWQTTRMRELLDEDEPDTPWYTKLPDDTPVECKEGPVWSIWYSSEDCVTAYRNGEGEWREWDEFDDIRMPEQPWWDDADNAVVYDDGDVYTTDNPESYSVGEYGVLHIYKRSDHE